MWDDGIHIGDLVDPTQLPMVQFRTITDGTSAQRLRYMWRRIHHPNMASRSSLPQNEFCSLLHSTSPICVRTHEVTVFHHPTKGPLFPSTFYRIMGLNYHHRLKFKPIQLGWKSMYYMSTHVPPLPSTGYENGDCESRTFVERIQVWR